jgi:hypothetical protein
MRRFSSSRAWARPTGESAEPGHANAVTAPLITEEDGDLWQPLPSRQNQPGNEDPVLQVFVELGTSLEEQEDARWRDLLQAMGFERQDPHVPVGFEDFDWSPIFPLDREHVARMLEPVVAKSGDIQEEINNMSTRASWPTP